ncbi:hypothetical protein GCK32_000569 [Trichostrongylus colubriformis]|uniref:DNA replication complex GINS protein PSF2 N-terminal domain-containing protein n=1 Tax=Trichostrongylus colubriformis TaxID=6319 RepID=A0AAN8F9V2_TRICO
MDPEHCEFLAEDEMIQIIPRRNVPVLHLVCGDVGPLEAGIPVKVPLWLAVDLRRKHHCEIVLKVLIQDLWDKREAKLRTSSLKLLSQHSHVHVRLDAVQPLEVSSIRPNLSACKHIGRLVRNLHNVQPD